jgi:hypothetical protein
MTIHEGDLVFGEGDQRIGFGKIGDNHLGVLVVLVRIDLPCFFEPVLT